MDMDMDMQATLVPKIESNVYMSREPGTTVTKSMGTWSTKEDFLGLCFNHRVCMS